MEIFCLSLVKLINLFFVVVYNILRQTLRTGCLSPAIHVCMDADVFGGQGTAQVSHLPQAPSPFGL